MRNIKLTIEYDGTDFCGWQVQAKGRTVAGELARAIKEITGEEPKIEYSSRTDSGVHANGQVANFSTRSRMPVEKIRKALNANLPEDVAVVDAVEVGKKFNARYDAKAKLYRYVISDSDVRPVIGRGKAYHFRWGRLDVRKMRAAARHLVGTHDFSSFGVNDREEKQDSPVRTISYIKVVRDDTIITIDVKGSGFLYKMVRSIAGTLIEAGRGKLPPKQVKAILAAKDRSQAGPTAPPQGLFLVKVYY